MRRAAKIVCVTVVLVLGMAIWLRIQWGKTLRYESAGTIDTIVSGLVSYHLDYGQYPDRLNQLGCGGNWANPSKEHACLIDDTLASGNKSGYRFEYNRRTT